MFGFMKNKKFSFTLAFIVLFSMIGISFAAYNPVDSPLAYKVNSGTRGYFQELNFPTGMVTATTVGSGRNIWHSLAINLDDAGGWSLVDANSTIYADANNHIKIGTEDSYLDLYRDSNGDGDITASGGEISFGNENLSTTGTLSASNTTVTKISVSLGDGGLYRYAIEADANTVIAIQVPSGAKIIGCQLRVDEALADGETWDAAYSTGATQAIASGAAVAVNTKVNLFFDENAATAITSGLTDVTITKNGGGIFTLQGKITAIVYYEDFTAMGDAS